MLIFSLLIKLFVFIFAWLLFCCQILYYVEYVPIFFVYFCHYPLKFLFSSEILMFNIYFWISYIIVRSKHIHIAIKLEKQWQTFVLPEIERFISIFSVVALVNLTLYISRIFSNQIFIFRLQLLSFKLLFYIIISAPLAFFLWKRLKIVAKIAKSGLKSDIRNIIYPKISFEPEKFYKAHKIFVGLTENYKPIYIDRADFNQMHSTVMGPTRCGKGVILQNLAAQALNQGDIVIWVDPKSDIWAPKIMKSFCEKNNVPFKLFNLRNQNDKYNPLRGGNIRDRQKRAENVFGYMRTGDENDFFRVEEKNFIFEALRCNSGDNAKNMYKWAKERETEKGHEKGAINDLWEFSQIRNLNPEKGEEQLKVRDIMQSGCFYFIGSLDDHTLRLATKFFLAEVIQQIQKRENANKHIVLVIDEFRFLTTKLVLDALATIAQYNVSIILAFQSLVDIEKVDDPILKNSNMKGQIQINCQLKFMFRAGEPETALWCSQLTGNVINVSENKDDAGKRALVDATGKLFDENIFLTLPSGVCVINYPQKNRVISKLIFSDKVGLRGEEL